MTEIHVAGVPRVVGVERGDGGWTLLSPGVGWWISHPHAGAVVGPGSRLGLLRTLNSTTVLILPDGAAGRIERLPRDRVVGVGYGETLCGLAPLGGDAQKVLEGEHVVAEGAAEAEAALPEGSKALVAPTDGVYYSRPHPKSPPFVEVGGRVRTGQPVGLVEVMKTFNQILYGGPGLPEEATVVEIRGSDGQEIQAGQILIVVR